MGPRHAPASTPGPARTEVATTPARDRTRTPAVKTETAQPSPFHHLDPGVPPARLDPPSRALHRGRDIALTPIKTELSQVVSPRAGPPDTRPTSASTVASGSTLRSNLDALNALSVNELSPLASARSVDVGLDGALASLKRSHSDDGGYPADDHPRRLFDGASAAPRSTPAPTPHDARREASFGAMEASRPRFSPRSATTQAFSRPGVPSSMIPSGPHTHPPAPSTYPSGYPSLSAAPPSSVGPAGPMRAGAGVGSAYGGGPSTSFVAPPAFAPLSLPPPGYATMGPTTPARSADGTYAGSPPVSLSAIAHQHPAAGAAAAAAAGSSMQPCVSDAVLFDPAPYAVPVFNSDGYVRSPFTMADDFVSWLLSEQHATQSSTLGQTIGSFGLAGLVDNLDPTFPSGYAPHDFSVDGFFPQTLAQPQHPMAVTSILDSGRSDSTMSEEKRQQLIELIEVRFNESDHAPLTKQKADLMEGDHGRPEHVLSLPNLQTYLWSYWYHFHPQLPLLHYPTFVVDQTQNLLLIAMIAIGASCLEKEHGDRITQQGAKLANFLAWHLRGEIFNHAHFRPPAKLWVFQALLLLEIYEKMFSTRSLHEGAHIHHATTITLMRRGTTLIGKSVVDTPPSLKDDKSTHGSNSSAQTPGATGALPPDRDRWWHEWITAEATRRAAFAAFVIDSLHATMFGHSAVLVAHEMQLPLPHDESLWAATNGAEVARLESSLNGSGIKRVRFLDGLKQTLNGQKVRTNSFGRTILMAGLLSVSWHMNQRDLQVSSLGVVQQLGGKDKWRGALTRAFDFWKRDFDTSLAENPETSSSGAYPYPGSKKVEDGIVFESKNVLHHLAHMAVHVDIVDCQTFARAGRLLGRIIGPQDYNSAQRRMKEWATTARARDATFYAVGFLSAVLLPAQYGSHGLHSPPLSEEYPIYSAREDYLMNRPWVLYVAALVVWSYGYALEGPLNPWRRPPSTTAEKQHDMFQFLRRVGSVGSPEMLVSVPGKNECVGTLMVLRDTFERTRWELLHEASRLLANCIEMLVGVGPS